MEDTSTPEGEQDSLTEGSISALEFLIDHHMDPCVVSTDAV